MKCICCSFKTLALPTLPTCPVYLSKITSSLCVIFTIDPAKVLNWILSRNVKVWVYCFKLMSMPLTQGKGKSWNQIMWPSPTQQFPLWNFLLFEFSLYKIIKTLCRNYKLLKCFIPTEQFRSCVAVWNLESGWLNLL